MEKQPEIKKMNNIFDEILAPSKITYAKYVKMMQDNGITPKSEEAWNKMREDKARRAKEAEKYAHEEAGERYIA